MKKDIRDKWESMSVNLEALFDGADPFSTPASTPTATDPAIALGFKSADHKAACWEKYGQLIADAVAKKLDISNFEDLDEDSTCDALTAKANALKALIASQDIDF